MTRVRAIVGSVNAPFQRLMDSAVVTARVPAWCGCIRALRAINRQCIDCACMAVGVFLRPGLVEPVRPGTGFRVSCTMRNQQKAGAIGWRHSSALMRPDTSPGPKVGVRRCTSGHGRLLIPCQRAASGARHYAHADTWCRSLPAGVECPSTPAGIRHRERTGPGVRLAAFQALGARTPNQHPSRARGRERQSVPRPDRTSWSAWDSVRACRAQRRRRLTLLSTRTRDPFWRVSARGSGEAASKRPAPTAWAQAGLQQSTSSSLAYRRTRARITLWPACVSRLTRLKALVDRSCRARTITPLGAVGLQRLEGDLALEGQDAQGVGHSGHRGASS